MPAADMPTQQGGPDWFKVLAIVALVLGGLAIIGGIILVLAAFLVVG